MKEASLQEVETASAEVFSNFFQSYPLERIQEELWLMLTSAMRIDNEYLDRQDRISMINFYENCMGFFKAVDLVKESEINFK